MCVTATGLADERGINRTREVVLGFALVDIIDNKLVLNCENKYFEKAGAFGRLSKDCIDIIKIGPNRHGIALSTDIAGTFSGFDNYKLFDLTTGSPREIFSTTNKFNYDDMA